MDVARSAEDDVFTRGCESEDGAAGSAEDDGSTGGGRRSVVGADGAEGNSVWKDEGLAGGKESMRGGDPRVRREIPSTISAICGSVGVSEVALRSKRSKISL